MNRLTAIAVVIAMTMHGYACDRVVDLTPGTPPDSNAVIADAFVQPDAFDPDATPPPDAFDTPPDAFDPDAVSFPDAATPDALEPIDALRTSLR